MSTLSFSKSFKIYITKKKTNIVIFVNEIQQRCQENRHPKIVTLSIIQNRNYKEKDSQNFTNNIVKKYHDSKFFFVLFISLKFHTEIPVRPCILLIGSKFHIAARGKMAEFLGSLPKMRLKNSVGI